MTNQVAPKEKLWLSLLNPILFGSFDLKIQFFGDPLVEKIIFPKIQSFFPILFLLCGRAMESDEESGPGIPPTVFRRLIESMMKEYDVTMDRDAMESLQVPVNSNR